jgi:hypothetical protein
MSMTGVPAPAPEAPGLAAGATVPAAPLAPDAGALAASRRLGVIRTPDSSMEMSTPSVVPAPLGFSMVTPGDFGGRAGRFGGAGSSGSVITRGTVTRSVYDQRNGGKS